MRAITLLDNGETRTYSRNGREATASFPELAAALAGTSAARRFVIDGEIVAPELPTGIPSFRRLQHRMHIARPPAALIASVPVQLFVFDVLAIDDTDTVALPYVQRRELLDELDLASALVRVPPYWTGIAPAQMLDVAADHGLEGIVSKRLASIYRPGQRSRSWIKTRCAGRRMSLSRAGSSAKNCSRCNSALPKDVEAAVITLSHTTVFRGL